MSAACMSSLKNSWRMILDCNQVKSAFQLFVFGLSWLGLWSNAMPTLSNVQYILVSMGWMKSSKMVPMARNVYYFGSTFLRAIIYLQSVALSNKKKQSPLSSINFTKKSLMQVMTAMDAIFQIKPMWHLWCKLWSNMSFGNS